MGEAHATKFFGNASSVAWTLSTKMMNTQRSSENTMYSGLTLNQYGVTSP
ncbi:hypothetical protein NEISICOT_00723 [Neisseria sicca ATCC 29256]|uniref:Uncharacterized protein n=1 Tax=Neisseria sicca ATCC 29256 TaxID=547045 RepID=C6M2I4_NEISI|nr:hypothetical protein NEISICOT_00723 [Neisseria sicca ATCC 29256]